MDILSSVASASEKEARLSRRALIGGTAAGTLAALRPGSSFGADTAATLPLVVTVTIGASSYVYRQDTAVDLGDFVSEIGGFTQGCLRATVANFPLTVFFRPDRSSNRTEVVFELGRLFSGTPADLGAYDVKITRGSEQVAALRVPAHYWFSRWRWQSAARPIVGNIDTLIKQGLLPPYDRTVVSAQSASAGAAPGAAAAPQPKPSVLLDGWPVVAEINRWVLNEHTLHAERGVTYEFAFQSDSLRSALIAVVDDSDNWLATNYKETGIESSLSFTAPDSLQYRVLVRSLDGNEGNYTLALGAKSPVAAPLPAPPFIDDYAGDTSSAGVLAVGGVVSGNLTTADRDDFKTTLVANTSYMLSVVSGSITSPLFTVRDQSGAVVARSGSDISVPFSFTFKPTSSGTFWLSVESSDASMGTYSLLLTTASQASEVYTVMGLAGVTAYMPQTGERPDIGLVTGSQGDFICTESATSLCTLRAQAEASGTIPWHMRDENTGAPISFTTYPDATWYSFNRGWVPFITTTPTPITVDSSHQPALAYLPYLLTGDPYYLEALQFQTNWNWGSLPPGFRPSVPQSRALAWSLRSMAQCAKITPKAVPNWLLPQSYWQSMLESYRTYIEQNFVSSISAPRAIFRSTSDIDNNRADTENGAPEATWIDPWQEEFLVAVLGWMIGMGFPNWRSVFDWKLASTVARTSKTSGWNRAYATPYRLMLRESRTAAYVDNWASALSLSLRYLKYSTAQSDVWAESDMTYLQYTFGALVLIDQVKAVDVAESLNWAKVQFDLRPSWLVPNKWRLISRSGVTLRSSTTVTK